MTQTPYRLVVIQVGSEYDQGHRPQDRLVCDSIAGYVVILIVAMISSPSNTDILIMTLVG